ncbi:MAG TPA: hypothetical protein VK756_08000 [Solirubrobacteraceae bacterium]|nr:hypothetical protein [Solirubrobacteraceae bacterium]
MAAGAVVALGAAVGASASTAAVWRFEGNTLKGAETIKAVAEESSFTLPGVKVTCEYINFQMTIENVAGVGEAKITSFLPEKCTSSTPTCTVESVEAQKLPWPAHLTTVTGEEYFVIEKMEVKLLLGGALCAFAETPILIKGTAGGVFSNVSHTITFNKNTFAATGTGLKVGATTIEWKAVFTTKALGAHKGEGLEG